MTCMTDLLLMSELILRELNEARHSASNLLDHYDHTYYHPGPQRSDHDWPGRQPTEEEWDENAGKDWIVVAGSYALHAHLVQTGEKPSWTPGDMDVWAARRVEARPDARVEEASSKRASRKHGYPRRSRPRGSKCTGASTTWSRRYGMTSAST